MFVGTMRIRCLLPVSLSLCEMFVCVSSVSSSSPSGAPASLLPLSSLGCDRSQLTPLLLWQRKNSLEKGQLAAFSLGLPGIKAPVLRGVGAPSVGHVRREQLSQLGLPLPIHSPLETFSLVSKEP